MMTRHGAPHQGSAPVAEGVVGRSDQHHREDEGRDGQAAGDPELSRRARDREPEDREEDQDRHPRRRAAAARTGCVVHQGGVEEEQVGGDRVEPGAFRLTAADDEEHDGQREHGCREAGTPTRAGRRAAGAR